MSTGGWVDRCRWCGFSHGTLCPYVKALTFDSTGTIVTKVEFHAPQPSVSAQGLPSFSDDGKAGTDLPIDLWNHANRGEPA